MQGAEEAIITGQTRQGRDTLADLYDQPAENRLTEAGKLLESVTAEEYDALDPMNKDRLRTWAATVAIQFVIQPFRKHRLAVAIMTTGPRPYRNCPHVDLDDGTCVHPERQTPECHQQSDCPMTGRRLPLPQLPDDTEWPDPPDETPDPDCTGCPNCPGPTPGEPIPAH